MSMALADELNALLGLGLESDWFRTPIVRGLELFDGKPAIDREARIIRGFAVATKGEARTHNVRLDDISLQQIIDQGNQTKLGQKSRFDHPNASSTSMGTALGRAKNFRRDGDIVRADLYLLDAASKAPSGDLAGYVMDLAEEDPGAFGASIVFQKELFEEKDSQGNPLKGDDGKPLLPVARVKKLMAVDVVDDPAANPNGFFSHNTLAAKVTSFLDRYFESKLQSTITREVRAMSAATEAPTAEQLRAAKDEGAKAERERVNAIQKLCKDMKTEFLAAELIEMGATVEEATKTCKLRRLSMMEKDAPESAGGGEDNSLSELAALPEGEEKWKKEFASTPALRDEFLGKESTYLAFKRAEANGQVKFYKGVAAK